jgi:hypothetical protein
MNVPVSEDLSTSRGLVEVWIEESMNLDFDLSGDGQYVDTGAVEGVIQVEFEINRSGLMDRLERAESPSIRDQINMFLEDWSEEDVDTDEVVLDYGHLLLEGAEPTQLPSELQLQDTFDTQELRSISPDDLKRELRREKSYETTYDELAEDVAEYLEEEGIAADPSFSAPVHMQATALPAEAGTDFTLTLENNEATAIRRITVKIEMPPQIGREASLGHNYDHDHAEDWTSSDAVSGTYDPEEQMFVSEVNSLSPTGEPGSSREIRFHVPARAQSTLNTIRGEAEFTRNRPFSNVNPIAIFDAGGNRLSDDLGAVNAKGRVNATFETPTDAVTVGGTAKVQKRFQIEGVTPIAAFQEIEDILNDRGVEGANFNSPDQTRDIREGKTTYDGSIRNGSIIIGNSRVSLDIHIDGDVRTSDRETSRENDEDLPAERRSVSVEYGTTGVNIIGKGADQQVVDDYVTDLRDEIQMSLKSMSEAM